MNKYIDIYCERLEPGLWAEPLNALTNLAFIIAAFLAFHVARKHNALDIPSGILMSLVFIIGIGSGLFHTFAVTWAMLMDVLPILLFQIAFIILYSRHVIGLKWVLIISILLLFFASMWGSMQLPREWLNGSLEYAPAIIFVSAFGLWHLKNAKIEEWGLLIAASIFLISMIFRSIDMSVCEAVPIGTHFMWHVLNACVLYATMRAFIRNKRIV